VWRWQPRAELLGHRPEQEHTRNTNTMEEIPHPPKKGQRHMDVTCTDYCLVFVRFCKKYIQKNILKLLFDLINFDLLIFLIFKKVIFLWGIP